MHTTLRSITIAFALTLAVGLAIRLVACAPDASTSDAGTGNHSGHANTAGVPDHDNHSADDHAGHVGNNALDHANHNAAEHANHNAAEHANHNAAEHADHTQAGNNTGTHGGSVPPRPDLVALGNTKCPVMGGTVGKNGFEFNGWWIGQCCPGCEDTFNESPDAFVAGLIEQTGIDVRVPPTDADRTRAAQPREFERGPDGTWRVGNAICPVMENEAQDDVGFAFNGWWISICCAGCDGKFEAAPDEYAPTLAEWTGIDVRKSPAEYGLEVEAGE